MNKKAGTFLVISWLAGAVVIIFFLAAWLFGFNLMTAEILEAGANVDSDVVNLTSATQNVLVPVDAAMNSLTWISFLMIATLAFVTLIFNYYIREHPVLFFVHLLVVILAVVASIYVSNAYEGFLQSGVLASTLAEFSVSSQIILLLPYWVAIIGIFGLVLLLINVTRDPSVSVKGGI